MLTHLECGNLPSQLREAWVPARMGNRSVTSDFYSDRKGSQFVGYFSRAARKWRMERGDTAVLRIVNIADLDGVPRLLRGTIKGNFKGTENGHPKSRVLLDWDGSSGSSSPRGRTRRRRGSSLLRVSCSGPEAERTSRASTTRWWRRSPPRPTLMRAPARLTTFQNDHPRRKHVSENKTDDPTLALQRRRSSG